MHQDEDSSHAEAALAALFHDTDIETRVREIFRAKPDGPPRGILEVEHKLLTRAIGALYDSFGDRQLSTPFDYCNCCITASMARRWQTADLRSLGEDDLWAIMTNVPCTAGTTADLLYFTPRILEHAAAEECDLDLSWMYHALQREDAPRATQSEIAALRGFFDLVWQSLRNKDCPGHPLSAVEVVLPTAVLTGEIDHYLDSWLGTRTIYTGLSSLQAGSDAWWFTDSDGYQKVRSWLLAHRADLTAVLSTVGFATEAERSAAELALIVPEVPLR
jgi:hypothetical protein